MAKRVKKGFQAKLASGMPEYFEVEVSESGGILRIDKPDLEDSMSLTVAQCEALGMTTVLEDVPEPKSPGQLHYEAEAAEFGYASTWDMVGSMQRDAHTRMAKRLGIKPEGE